MAGNQVTYNGSNQVLTVNQSGSPVNLSDSFTYDAAGNAVNDIANQYLYDGEGRLCAVKNEPVPNTYTLTQYVYDGGWRRSHRG